MRAQGSPITFAIWIGAFAVRFIARFVVPHGADPRTQLPLNAGTVALVATAFIVIALAFYRAIGRYRKRCEVSVRASAAVVPSMNGRISPTNLSVFRMLRRITTMASDGKPDSSVTV